MALQTRAPRQPETGDEKRENHDGGNERVGAGAMRAPYGGAHRAGPSEGAPCREGRTDTGGSLKPRL